MLSKSFLASSLLLAFSVGSSSGSPVTRSYGCPSIERRPEWRTLTADAKKSYIDSVKCLATKPSTLNAAPVSRLYDDFPYVHATLVLDIHWTASFLPWHRYFIYIYHQALKQHCGYKGPLPYWSWDTDWQDITKSPVWSSDKETGLGSNGTGAVDADLFASAVTDGAFANWRLEWPNQHLLTRNFSTSPTYGGPYEGPYERGFYSPEAMDKLYAAETFPEFHLLLEGTNLTLLDTPKFFNGPHAAIHLDTGGDMSPLDHSANDPIFFLHHGNVDRIWAKWQDRDPAKRIRPVESAYIGNVIQNSTINDATLNDKLDYLGLAPNVTVASQLDTRAAPWCYEYAEP